MEIRRAEASDFARIKPEAMDGWAAHEIRVHPETMADWCGRAFTAVVDGEPVGIAGIAVEGSVGRAWMIGSVALRGRPMFLHRVVKRALASIRTNPLIGRIEIEALHPVAERWAERLGFRFDASRACWMM